MSMLTEQRQFEAAVKARYGLRERPTTPKSLERFALDHGMEVHEAEKVLYSPLDHLSRGWCEAHSEHLKARLDELGLTHKSPAAKLGTDGGTMWRMLKATTRPRIQTLAPVLEALQQVPEEYLALSSEAKELRGNPFAWALQNLRKELGYSQVGMSERLGMLKSVYGALESAKSYPTGELAARLELATGVTVAESKAWELNRKESTDGLDPLGKLIRQARIDHGWDAQEAAERCGVSKLTYRSHEEGTYKQLQHATLRKVADGLGLRYDEVSWVAFGALDPVGETFNQRLKRLRQERLLSGNDVARAAGMHNFVYRRYEEADHFPTYTAGRLEAIADAIGVTPEELLGEGTRFGRWLKRALSDASITREDLALVLGEDEEVTKAWISGIMKPDFTQVRSISRLLNVDVYEIRQHLMA